VRWKIGLAFGAAAMAGAFAGGRLASFVPATALLVAFGLIMLATAISMLRPRNELRRDDDDATVHWPSMLALGSAVGVVSGLVGAGGGFLIVPALTTFGRLSMRAAIGTSLFVIALQSFAGFAGHAGVVAVDWSLVAAVTSASIGGAVIGTFAGRKVSPAALRRAFAWVVLAMGVFVIAKQVQS
jgi:uncharacterized membrane protein YfcA